LDYREHWKLVREELLSRGLSHETINTYATYAPWLMDEEFNHLLEKVREHTMVDVYRLWELFDITKMCQDIPGDVLEVGVWRGGTGAFLTTNSPNKLVYLADTFTGVVNPSDNDFSYNGGEHADTSVQIVEELLKSIGSSNYFLLQGEFPSETGHLIPDSLCFVHIDVDVYDSARQIWEFIQGRISLGGVVVFDDYGFSSTDGVTKLVNEIRTSKRFKFFYNLNGHAILIRIE
jgi:O-methyltransferase